MKLNVINANLLIGAVEYADCTSADRKTLATQMRSPIVRRR